MGNDAEDKYYPEYEAGWGYIELAFMIKYIKQGKNKNTFEFLEIK